ncbi:MULTISPECIES: ScbR family autoregulator-binding transcription factor [unclassified Streptomyces]|jgi:AcrR family transcriptional regulator|uniref:ScbR family autoregulator-binding transcription factor n=1 Tax=unclassified Streptomyces TaxID=2593676 RepID=UPI0011807B71|nr:ScbR family autoregulator-binding transcription factor [Streptomyces sp. IB201691-2A2]TRO62515.1 TetR/AcrR family transcriptional regulator [Streptomyces sp. IB201691-2A2]
MAQQERAVRTRNALIESAAELFCKDGFDVVSLSTISARAGVSNGALHFHFASKAALAVAVWEAAAQRLGRITAEGRARSEAAATAEGTGGTGPGGPLQVLVDATHALLRGLRHDVILRAGFDLSESPVPVAAGADLRRRWQAWVEGVLAEAAREGTLARDVSPQDAAHAVVAATVGFGALGSRNAQWLSQSMLTRFWALLLPRLATEVALKGLVASGRREGMAGADGVPSPFRVTARSGA